MSLLLVIFRWQLPRCWSNYDWIPSPQLWPWYTIQFTVSLLSKVCLSLVISNAYVITTASLRPKHVFPHGERIYKGQSHRAMSSTAKRGRPGNLPTVYVSCASGKFNTLNIGNLEVNVYTSSKPVKV